MTNDAQINGCVHTRARPGLVASLMRGVLFNFELVYQSKLNFVYTVRSFVSRD